MKIERLIGIITTLQQRKFVTAPYLAEKFEVSRRTINRDIEDICKAGIPIVTTQGANGGISIMEGFALDTTIFTEQELSAIFAGLTLPAGTWLGFEWAIGSVMLAVLFFGICLLCKQSRAKKEEQKADESQEKENTDE